MPLRRVWYVQRRFGWDEKVEFVPYWSNPAVLDLEPKDPAIVASVFKRPGRIMIVVMNNTSRPDSGIEVTGADLRAAMDAVRAGESVSADQKNSIGCNIKWKPGEEP